MSTEVLSVTGTLAGELRSNLFLSRGQGQSFGSVTLHNHSGSPQGRRGSLMCFGKQKAPCQSNMTGAVAKGNSRPSRNELRSGGRDSQRQLGALDTWALEVVIRTLHFLLRVMTDLFYYSSGRAGNASAACLGTPRRGRENRALN